MSLLKCNYRLCFTPVRKVFKPPSNLPYAGIYRNDGDIVRKNDFLVVKRRMNYHPGLNVCYGKNFSNQPPLNPNVKETNEDKIKPQNSLLHITPKAVEQLKKITGNDELLRVSVDSGGCSGFEYKLLIDNVIHADDEIIQVDGAKVVVDSLSLEFIRGSKLDFKEDLMRSAFRIIDNPTASQGCSCGSSFTPTSMA